MDRLEFILGNLPDFLNKTDLSSNVRCIVKAIADEISLTDESIQRIDDIGGIDTTNGDDIEAIWGNLVHIPRKDGEDYNIYKNRIKTSISSLSGGTASAIQYAVAVALGINSDSVLTQQRIKVYDGWEYDPSDTNVNDGYGNSVVTIDLNNQLFSYSGNIKDIVESAIQGTKASGVNVQLVFSNFRVVVYTELANISYGQLRTIRYDQIGG